MPSPEPSPHPSPAPDPGRTPEDDVIDNILDGPFHPEGVEDAMDPGGHDDGMHMG